MKHSQISNSMFLLLLDLFLVTYVKQVVLINHSWISPTLQMGSGLEFCLFFKKWGKVHFSQK